MMSRNCSNNYQGDIQIQNQNADNNGNDNNNDNDSNGNQMEDYEEQRPEGALSVNHPHLHYLCYRHNGTRSRDVGALF
jgi:hypothetical protein